MQIKIVKQTLLIAMLTMLFGAAAHAQQSTKDDQDKKLVTSALIAKQEAERAAANTPYTGATRFIVFPK